MIDKVRINGNVVSWGSIILRVAGEEISGFIGFDYGQKRERAYQWGSARDQAPRGRTRGKWTPNPVKLTVVRGTMADLINFLKAKAPDGISYGDVNVQIVAQWIESDETAMKVECIDCVLVEESATDEEGNEGLKDEISFMPMRMKRNGGTLYDSTRR